MVLRVVLQAHGLVPNNFALPLDFDCCRMEIRTSRMTLGWAQGT
jgi:hypothetical protein